jgi:hypothetical protein
MGTVTGMGLMVSKNRKADEFDASPMSNIGRNLLALSFSFSLSPVYAVDWLVEPSLVVRELYSDNITLGGGAQQAGGSLGQNGDDAFVTELSPGISIRRLGRNVFSLDYRMQNLFYAGTDADPRINNQLQMRSNTEILDDSVFVDSSSTIGQYNTSTTGRFAFDNISRTGNTNEYRTFRIGPYWRPHLGGYAEGIVGVTYSNIGGGGFDSNIFEQRIDVRSGNRFDTVTWRANFYNQENTRDNGVSGIGGTADVKYRNYNGELRYRLTKQFSPFIQAGHFDNDFLGRTNVVGARNGSYWTAGLAWTPSAKLAVQGGAGSNNHFLSLTWEPSKRTTFQVIYRDSDIGGAYAGGGFGGSGYAGGGFGGAGFGGGGFGGGGFGGGGFGGGGLGGGGFGGGGFGGGGFGGGGFGGAGFGGGGFGGADFGGAGFGGAGFGGAGFGGAGFGGAGFGGAGFGGGGFGGGGFGGGGFGGGGFGGGGFGGGGFGGGGFGGIGLGGFNAGTTWNALLSHRTRRTNWIATYTMNTTTIQQILLDQPVFNPLTSQPFLLPIDQPNLTNEVITRKRGQASVFGYTAKSTVTLTGYQEDRSYQFSGDQDVLGFSASWSWRFAARTQSFFYFVWQAIDNQSPVFGNSDNKFMAVSLALNRRIWADLMGSLELRHMRQDSNRSENEYDENRVTASLLMRF